MSFLDDEIFRPLALLGAGAPDNGNPGAKVSAEQRRLVAALRANGFGRRRVPGRLTMMLAQLPLTARSAHHHVVLSLIRAFRQAAKERRFQVVFTGQALAHEDGAIAPRAWHHRDDPESRRFLASLSVEERAAVEFVFPPDGRGVDGLAKAHAHALRAIDDFAPEVVIFFAGIYASTPLEGVLAPFFPLVVMHFNVQNRIPEEADVVLGYLPPPRQAVDCPYVAVPSWPSASPANCGDFPDPRKPGATVMATALIGNRVSAALKGQRLPCLDADHKGRNEEFIERLVAMFRRHPSLHWWVIGEYSPDNLRGVHPALDALLDEQRIVVRHFIDNLGAFLARCDIYLQPLEAHGGGGAAVMAATGRLPIVVFNDCDPLRTMPRPALRPSIDGGFDYLERLITDSSFRAGEGSACFAEVSKTVEEIDFAPYNDAIACANARFEARR